MIGPAVAGVLIVLVGTGWVFIINAVTFFAMLVALVMLQEHAAASACRGRPARGQFVAGFRYVARRPDL